MIAPIRVMVVDDAPESRVALKRLLVDGRFAVAGEASDAGEAVVLARETRPEAVVVSLEEPVARPLKAIESLSTAAPDAPVVVVSSLTDKEYLRRAMLAGARDFLSQPVTMEELR